MDGRNVKSTLEFDNNVAKVRDPRTSAGRYNRNRTKSESESRTERWPDQAVRGSLAKVTEKWDGKTSTITYAVKNDQMVITCEMNGVVCERFHDKA